jgi:hypothetical protein
VEQLSDENKRALFKHWTDLIGLPANGFTDIRLSIVIVNPADPIDKTIIVSHTCYNQLDLPNVSDPDVMKSILLNTLHQVKHIKGFTFL